MNKHTARLLEQHFDTAFAAPDGVKKLRELILTLAMQGKLVPQDTPNSLVELRNVATKIGSGSTPSGGKSVYKKKGIPLIRSMNVHFGGFKHEGLAFIDDEQARKLNNVIVEVGDVLLNITGASIGRVTLAPTEMDGARVNQHVCIIRLTDRVLPHYLELCLASPLIQNRIFDVQVGATREALTKSMIERFTIPVPSLEQQHRIIAKIDELMARCDELEKLRTSQQEKRLTVHAATIRQLLNIAEPDQHQRVQSFLAEHFGELYTVKENVAELRKAILQLAVIGKLVPQNPNDQPASELLKEIEAEKQRLVQEGKIKKPKPLSPVTEKEKPYALPQGWKWVRLGHIALSSDSGWSPQCLPEMRKGQEWGVLKVSAVSWGKFNPNENKALPTSQVPRPECEVKRGDFLISRANTDELVARSVVVEETPPHLMMSDKIVRFTLSGSVNKAFVNMVNGAPYSRSYYIENASGTSSSMKNVSRETMSLLPVPLPPLAEQNRIITKIDELMALCDSLDYQIDTATSKQAELLNALMHPQSQSSTEEEPQQVTPSKSQVIDLATYRASIGCYALGKLANTLYFGRTAAAKVMYLAEAHIGLPLQQNPMRKKAGPLDKWMTGFEQQGQSQGWFKVTEKILKNGYTKTEYRCLPALSELTAKAEALMSVEQQTEFDRLIYALADKKTEEVEIIATLFAVWNDFLIDGIPPKDDRIIIDMRENWHESKARFSPAELKQWLGWLRKENFVPRGLPPRTVQQSRMDFN